MFKHVFPRKDPLNKDPEKRIDCGEPSLFEQLSGHQEIAFPIKGYAMLRFELFFRLFRSQLQEYVDILQPEYPGVTFYVYENKLSLFIEVEELCNTNPLTTPFNAASRVHDQTYLEVRKVMSVVDDIYERIIEMHFQKYNDSVQRDIGTDLERPAILPG